MLVFDTFVFVAAAVAAVRLPVSRPHRAAHPSGEPEPPRDATARGPDSTPTWPACNRSAEPEVLLGLTANSLLRGIAGFFVFMLAFGLRR